MTDFHVADSAIRQLQARYADAVWRRDIDAFVDCFAAGAEWKIAGMHMRGCDEIRSQIAKFLAPSERVMIWFGNPVLDVGNGTANGRTQTTEYVKLLDGRAIRTLGVYYERFVEQGDRWRFHWRHFNLYYYGPPDFSAPLHECREYGPPPGMPGLDDPTTVRQNL
jgi:hypothetical protein